MSGIRAVGDTYLGSKVTNIEEVISDRGAMVRRRNIITLQNGMIVTENHYEEKAVVVVDEGEYKEIPVKEIAFRPEMPDVTGNAEKRKKVKSKSTSGRKAAEKAAKDAEEDSSAANLDVPPAFRYMSKK
jgi:hypothetical protein